MNRSLYALFFIALFAAAKFFPEQKEIALAIAIGIAMVFGSAVVTAATEWFSKRRGAGRSRSVESLRYKLFLPHFSTKVTGMGLGLPIVSEIVNEHGGTIRVEDNQPSGTRFVIEVPVSRAVIPVEA